MLILVVDDDDLVRRVVADLLEDLDQSVVEAASGEEALWAIRGGTRFDLVISDVNMPRMDGLRLSEEIRTLHPMLPVILMSGRRYVSEGCGFLPKPFTRDDLLGAIAQATAKLPQEAEFRVSPP